MVENSTGKCAKCGIALTKRKMEKHVLECFQDESGTPMLCLRVDGGGPYWLYVAAKEFAPLAELDGLLRRVWLECCGHLSSFECPSGTYWSSPEYGEKGMKGGSIIVALPAGRAVHYEYDFGTTTVISITRVGELKAMVEKPVFVMARNDMPEMACELCKNAPATRISRLDNKLVCGACGDNMKKDKEYLLPYVNSPRTGMCGYTGED